MVEATYHSDRTVALTITYYSKISVGAIAYGTSKADRTYLPSHFKRWTSFRVISHR
ncbi:MULTISPECIES: hypothetical protein [unclassified Coleofasciculus]|uniref:hypothetical protein n=1 Tax=unclassified Coleofasciculus TaxID=2692782 RepID=UPI00188099DA|nr:MULTISPECIES: hypothetical protein [unclassified Coleofasciculus]MBE9128641.1 hypothetical protein [Coleofasciculus sp. LEGE 07081]MBE9147253.1 hypothetical protein [Coleofasciculus sp. LEGE 07092]